MAGWLNFPNVPYHLLQDDDVYRHREFVANEIRCIRAFLEAGTRCYDAHHRYFPHDHLNNRHMANIMARRGLVERAIDAWEQNFEFTPPSEADAHMQLRNLYYRAVEVLSHMGPGFEAYRRFPAPGVSWCAQGPFPVTRVSTPHTLLECFNRVTYNVEERRELALELMADMQRTQAENSRLRQELAVNARLRQELADRNRSIRDTAAYQNQRYSRLEQAMAELELINLAQRIQLGQL